MQTRIRINRKTGEVTFDVLDGVGQSCRNKNQYLYDAVRQRFNIPDDAVKEDCKPEMQLSDSQTQEQTQHG